MISQYLVIIGLLFTSNIMAAESHVALVIGNNNYTQKPLDNPANDARSISSVLNSLGFDVLESIDANRFELESILARFGEKAKTAEIAIAYYAGHGIQVDGENYLIPIDVELRQRRDLRKLLNLKDLTYEAQQAKHLGLVILDACRDNPFADRLARSLGRSISERGLARVENTAGNVLVAFATKDNAIAEDGNGENSPYAEALIKYLPQVGVEVRHLFGRIRDSVMQTTDNRQQPYTYGTLGGQLVYLAGEHVTDKDMEYWADTQKCNKISCYNAYLEYYPEGRFIEDARQWLSKQAIKTTKVETESIVSTSPISVSKKPIGSNKYFQDNGDGTVTDLRTKLQWMKCSLGQIWEGSACRGRALNLNFKDSKTQAKEHSKKGLYGYSGWRVPKKNELLSLVYCSSGAPLFWGTNGTGCLGNYNSPAILESVFPNTDDSKFYWALENTNPKVSVLKAVNFYNGKLESSYPYGKRFVRLVRSNKDIQLEKTNNER